MSNFGDNIRNIAKTGELEKSIEQILNSKIPDNKEPLPSTRTTAYETANGGVSTASGTGGSGTTQSTGSAGSSATGADSAGGGGSGGDSENPDNPTGKQNADAFAKTAAELFSAGASIGERIDAITGIEDCSSGDTADLRLDGQFLPPTIVGYDGYGYFDDAADDPRNENFTQGIFYTAPGGQKSDNPWAAVTAYLPALDAADPSNAPHVISSVPSYDPLTDSNVNVQASRKDGVTFGIAVSITAPGSCTVGSDAWCPTSPSIDKWPAQGKHQLAFDGAQFVSPPLQDSVDDLPQFKNNPSKISGCTGGGNVLTVEADGDGNKKVTFDNGDVYKIGADGIVTAAP